MGHSEYADLDACPMIFMIHMPVFFVVSGYLFNADKSLWQITHSNTRGLLVPYVMYNLLFAAYWVALGTVRTVMGQPYDWTGCLLTPAWHFLSGIALGNFDGPTWFLLALVWCKYMSYVLHQGRLLARAAVLLFWGVLLFVRISTGRPFVYALDCACAGVIWFEAGYLARLRSKRLHLPLWVYVLSIPMGFAVCYYVMKHNGSCNYILADVGGLYGLFGTVCGLMAYFSFCRIVGCYECGLVTLVSKASIVVMCLHMMFNGPLNGLIHYWNHTF